MASITLERVRKAYDNGQIAVRDVMLEVADGELMVLVGPSGSGKSSVLRLIAGLDTPTSGRVLLDGRDATQVPPQHRDLAMVFQSYALYPHLTVRENLSFGLRMRRVNSATIAPRIMKVAVTLGLEPLLDRKPAQLSGGERQRVALGRALVREPRAFLLDEPLSNLDPTLRAGTRTELALLHRGLKATMVYVTHDQEEAMTLGTRIAVMRAGAIEQVGPPMELFRRPANAFVAGFIGSPAMNLLPCVCSRDAGRLRACCGPLSVEVGDLSLCDAGAETILLGVRAHDVDIVSASDGDAAGRVEVVESLGSTTLLHVRLAGLPETTVRVVVSGDAGIRLDDPIAVRVRRDRLHVFDATTNRRLN